MSGHRACAPVALQSRRAALCLAAAVAVAVAGSCVARSGAAGAAPKPAPKPTLTALHFGGAFVPTQLTAAAGRIWVVGTADPGSFTDCALEEVVPSTMATTKFPLPVCPTDIAAVDGEVDMVAAAGPPQPSNTHEMHLEVFDPNSGQARLLAPIVMRLEGSGIAHTSFSAGAGALWLYGYQMGAHSQVVGISPQTGAVTTTVTNPPDIGGIFPAVAVNAGGQWFGGGPGGPPGLTWSDAGGMTKTVYAGPSRSSILWLSAVDATVWAGVDVDGSATRPSNVTHLVAVNGRGHVIISTRPELIGDYPLVATSDGHLWSMEVAGTCGGAAELVEVDPASGESHAVEALPAPAASCNDAGTGSQVTAVGRDVFALIPTGSGGTGVLYRVAP
jgi:hypothetical protein